LQWRCMRDTGSRVALARRTSATETAFAVPARCGLRESVDKQAEEVKTLVREFGFLFGDWFLERLTGFVISNGFAIRRRGRLFAPGSALQRRSCSTPGSSMRQQYTCKAASRRPRHHSKRRSIFRRASARGLRAYRERQTNCRWRIYRMFSQPGGLWANTANRFRKSVRASL
jgi:hypothetical protein